MSQQEHDGDSSTADERKKLTFHYIKSNAFRVIHVDGAWGGVTPSLKIQMALYSERTPIPQQTVHEFTEETPQGEELRDERISREGIIREVETEAVMDIDTTESLIEFLKEKVKQARVLDAKVKKLRSSS